MTRRGRPIRFLAAVLIGWTGLRVIALWPTASVQPVPKIALAAPAVTGLPVIAAATAPAMLVARAVPAKPGAAASEMAGEAAFAALPDNRSMRDFPNGMLLAYAARTSLLNRQYGGHGTTALKAFAPSAGRIGQRSVFPTTTIADIQPRPQSRLSLATWLFYRPSSRADSLAPGGIYGASQAGVRLAYALDGSGRGDVAAYARATAPLDRLRGSEAAAGIAVRPMSDIPVAIAMERRMPLGAEGRAAFSAFAAGGFGPSAALGRFRLEGYGQAGVVGFARHDLFAEGKLSLDRPIFHAEGTEIALGGAVSGGAQPDASRLDLGPQLTARLPQVGRGARLVLEWRERMAGDAHPDSGPALTLAADF